MAVGALCQGVKMVDKGTKRGGTGAGDGAGDGRGAGRGDGTDRLAQIRALLAKAEATEFPAEAESFTAKAMELIARYAIDEALLWAEDSGEQEPQELRLVLLAPYLGPKAFLASGVAQACGCQAIRLGSGGAGNPGNSGSEVMSIWGFPSDIEVVEQLLTSLMVQMATALLASEADLRGQVGKARAGTANWRRSFMVGFADEAVKRVRATRARAAEEQDATVQRPGAKPGASTASAAVALRDRDQAVSDAFRRQFPRIRQSRTSAGSSGAARQKGRSAGRRADVGGQRLRNRRALPK